MTTQEKQQYWAQFNCAALIVASNLDRDAARRMASGEEQTGEQMLNRQPVPRAARIADAMLTEMEARFPTGQ